jgi:isoleucyl-tRNA synthetase
MSVVTMGRTLRTEYNLKVRQPLSSLHVVCRDKVLLDHVQALEEIIIDELNIKAVSYSTEDSELATMTVKPNFRVLGPKLGAHVKEAAKVLAGLSQEDLHALSGGEHRTIDVGERNIDVRVDDLVMEREPKEGLAVKSEGALVVALEVELNPELIQEGLARELLNKVQNMRKDANLEVTQRIKVQIQSDQAVAQAVLQHADYIKQEALCTILEVNPEGVGESTLWDLNGHPCHITIEPA